MSNVDLNFNCVAFYSTRKILSIQIGNDSNICVFAGKIEKYFHGKKALKFIFVWRNLKAKAFNFLKMSICRKIWDLSDRSEQQGALDASQGWWQGQLG